MNNSLLTRSAAVLAAGGLAWLAKMAVIAATDGAVDGIADTVAGGFYLLGVALMPAGLAGLGVAIASGRHVAVRAVAALAGFIAFFPVYVIVESIAQGVTGDTDPVWVGDEIGILATGAMVMAGALTTISRATAARLQP